MDCRVRPGNDDLGPAENVGAMRTEKEKMLAGELYRPGDAEIQADLAATRAWLARYNVSLARSSAERWELLAERLADVGPDTVVRPPFHCDFGFNIRLGSNVFLNFSCVILDVVEVVIADGAQIGPAVQIYAADHPRDPVQRRGGLEFGRPVRIGRNAWIGGGAIQRILFPGSDDGDIVCPGRAQLERNDTFRGPFICKVGLVF